MARDFREERDARRRERELHLQLRRVSGSIITGGRSSATVSISSTTGLAETETIQLAAVNSLTSIFDTTDIPFGSYAAWEELERVEIVGGGFPVLINCVDNYSLTTVTLDTQMTLHYRMRVLDPQDAEVFSTGQLVFQLTSVGGDGITVAAQDAYMTGVVELEEGLTYTLILDNQRNRSNVADVLDGASSERSITIHELKR